VIVAGRHYHGKASLWMLFPTGWKRMRGAAHHHVGESEHQRQICMLAPTRMIGTEQWRPDLSVFPPDVARRLARLEQRFMRMKAAA
jgi:hypothetical protein